MTFNYIFLVQKKTLFGIDQVTHFWIKNYKKNGWNTLMKNNDTYWDSDDFEVYFDDMKEEFERDRKWLVLGCVSFRVSFCVR